MANQKPWALIGWSRRNLNQVHEDTRCNEKCCHSVCAKIQSMVSAVVPMKPAEPLQLVCSNDKESIDKEWVFWLVKRDRGRKGE